MGNEATTRTNRSALNGILTVSPGIPFIFLNEYVTIYTKDVIRMFNFREVEGTYLDYKLALEEGKPKSWLKSVSAFRICPP